MNVGALRPAPYIQLYGRRSAQTSSCQTLCSGPLVRPQHPMRPCSRSSSPPASTWVVQRAMPGACLVASMYVPKAESSRANGACSCIQYTQRAACPTCTLQLHSRRGCTVRTIKNLDSLVYPLICPIAVKHANANCFPKVEPRTRSFLY